MGHEPADLAGLAVSNLAFAEELYYPVPARPRQRRRRLAALLRYAEPRERRDGGAAVPAPPDAFKRSIFAGSGVTASRGGRDRQPHVGAPAVRARAASGRGVSRDGTPVRAARSARAREAPASGDRARGLRARRRGPRPGVQQRKRRGPRPHDAARSDGSAARDLLPHHRRRAGPPARRRAARRGCRTGWRARATGWR